MSGTRSLHQAKGIGVKVSASPDTSTRRERDSGDATENESTDLLRTMCDTSFRLQAALRQGEPRSLATLSLRIPVPWNFLGCHVGGVLNVKRQHRPAGFLQSDVLQSAQDRGR